ncbi:MAG: ABC transporter ATP-binding protein [Firmicutes bacterium]|nr:ABC transporter ATP-binding protein [Bacillota bacterium]
MELFIDRLTKQYGAKLAVDRFTLKLSKGIYGLLGPNGSGKTTLLRMIADVLRPTSGEITVDGVDIRRLDEAYRDVLGYLPQDFGYYRDFTAIDYLMYLSAVKGLKKNRAEHQTKKLLAFVGLENEAKNKIKSFSGGMRQRLGIAQALLNDPGILILDEPTAGLDPQERIRFRNIISDISENKIVLLSTHIVSDIEYIAGQVIMMKNGELLKQGTVQELAELVMGKVWSFALGAQETEAIKAKHIIANLKHTENGVELRIVADNPPHEKAVSVPPTIEDTYLYYFNEVNAL